jgi:hypothetical protein
MSEDQGPATALLTRGEPEYAGPGTTTVLPPAGPGAPPITGTATGPEPPRRGVPLWVFIVSLIAVAVVVGTLAVVLLGPATPHTSPNIPANVTTTTAP